MTQLEVVWRLIARWITPADATVVRAAVCTFHALIAARGRDRRLRPDRYVFGFAAGPDQLAHS